MARKSPFEDLKPEVFRLLAEGLTGSEILMHFAKQGQNIPKSTVYDWIKEFRMLNPDSGKKKGKDESQAKPSSLSGVQALQFLNSVDPDNDKTELQRIRDALWDVVNGEKSANPTVVNALRGLIDTVRLEYSVIRPFEVESADMERLSDEELQQIVDG